MRLEIVYLVVMNESSEKKDLFPQRLRTAREQRGLNQAELAVHAKLQASAISHFETGTRKPSFDNLRRLADALKVTTDYLLGRVESFDALAGADTLHRHYHQLSSEDQKFAEDMINMLVKKTRDRKDKKG